MAEFNSENENLNNSGAAVESSAATVQESSAGQPAGSAADSKDDLAVKSIDDRSNVEDVDDTHRNITVTEKDGTRIELQLVAPAWGDAENIDAKRSRIVSSDGDDALELTPKRFHEGLFALIKGLKVDDRPAGQFNWGFAQQHSRETYNFIMNQADTFLTNQLNPAE